MQCYATRCPSSCYYSYAQLFFVSSGIEVQQSQRPRFFAKPFRCHPTMPAKEDFEPKVTDPKLNAYLIPVPSTRRPRKFRARTPKPTKNPELEKAQKKRTLKAQKKRPCQAIFWDTFWDTLKLEDQYVVPEGTLKLADRFWEIFKIPIARGPLKGHITRRLSGIISGRIFTIPISKAFLFGHISRRFCAGRYSAA